MHMFVSIYEQVYTAGLQIYGAQVIVPWFQNMAHHFPRQWAQWPYPF